MNISTMLGHSVDYTNFSYVEQLWRLGLWPLSVLTFWTAILNPGLMMLALAWCVLSVWGRSGRWLILKTKLFRLVTEAVRWSQSGPISIVLFVPLFDFGALGSEAAGWGATAFVIMVVMTMLAALAFDPRLMWDTSATAPQ
jgi:paraquat-inducible protein A